MKLKSLLLYTLAATIFAGGGSCSDDDGGKASIATIDGSHATIDLDLAPDAAAVAAAIADADAKGVTAYTLKGDFAKSGIGAGASLFDPIHNPFAGTNAETIDLTGVTDWPETDTDGDGTTDGAAGIPAFAFYGWIDKGVPTYYYPALKTVKLPAEVKAIGSAAFFACEQLESINPEQAEIIGRNAFSGCKALKKVNLSGAKEIQEKAFVYCSALEETVIGGKNETTLGVSAFASCSALKRVDGPTVKSVGESAFSSCKKLTDLSMPNATEIGNGAFGASGLVSVRLDRAAVIGLNAFIGCTALETLDLPAATNLGIYFLQGCNSLTTLKLTVAGNFSTGESAMTAEQSEAVFSNFNHTAACALTLNRDKHHETGTAEPKAASATRWCKGTGQTDLEWKSIAFE